VPAIAAIKTIRLFPRADTPTHSLTKQHHMAKPQVLLGIQRAL
jgi:hypothetical protein